MWWARSGNSISRTGHVAIPFSLSLRKDVFVSLPLFLPLTQFPRFFLDGSLSLSCNEQILRFFLLHSCCYLCYIHIEGGREKKNNREKRKSNMKGMEGKGGEGKWSKKEEEKKEVKRKVNGRSFWDDLHFRKYTSFFRHIPLFSTFFPSLRIERIAFQCAFTRSERRRTENEEWTFYT